MRQCWQIATIGRVVQADVDMRMARRALEPRRATATDAVEVIPADFGAPGAVVDADLGRSAAALTPGGVGEQPRQATGGGRIVRGAGGGDHMVGCGASESSSQQQDEQNQEDHPAESRRAVAVVVAAHLGQPSQHHEQHDDEQ